MANCVIFDLDGTLADVRHRLHHIKSTPPDWTAFFDGCVDDGCHDYVRHLNHIVATGLSTDGGPITVFVCSGRPDSHRQESEDWLDHNHVEYDMLLMREAGDHRPDVVVKKEMLDGIRGQGYDVLFAVDDRPSVVQMWRENGVPCLAVDDSDWKQTAGVSFAGDLEGQTLLTMMVGPTHAGKDHWLWAYLNPVGEGYSPDPRSFGIHPEHVVSSDQVRMDLGIEGHTREDNDRVFSAVHGLARERMRHGLPVVINATSIRRRDRLACVDLAPVGTRVRYLVIDRPLDEKVRFARSGFPHDVIRRHDQTFRSQVHDVLDGDGRGNVDVVDLRKLNWRVPS